MLFFSFSCSVQTMKMNDVTHFGKPFVFIEIVIGLFWHTNHIETLKEDSDSISNTFLKDYINKVETMFQTKKICNKMQHKYTSILFKNVERYFCSQETTELEEDQLYQRLCELKIPIVYYNKPTKNSNNRHEIIKFYKRYYKKPNLALTLFEYFLVAYSKTHKDVENCKKAIDDANE